MSRPRTLGELRKTVSGDRVSVREEMRRNHVRHDALEILARTPPLAA